MKMIMLAGLVLSCLCWLGTGASAAGAAGGLKVGDPAPSFRLPGSDGKTHALSDFKGKKAVVIAWFPKAFTGG